MSNFTPTVTISLAEYNNLQDRCTAIDDLINSTMKVRSKYNNFEIKKTEYIKELGEILADYIEE